MIMIRRAFGIKSEMEQLMMKKIISILGIICLLWTSVCFCSAEKKKEDIISDVVQYYEDEIRPVNQLSGSRGGEEIELHFDKATGTLTVSGDSSVCSLFPISDDYMVQKYIDDACLNIKHIRFEEGIVSIYDSFNRCHNLIDIQLPSTIGSIGDSFNDCENLVVKELSSNISDSFNRCDSIKEITFDGDETYAISGAFDDCDSLETVHASKFIEVVGSFDDCDSLKTVHFQDYMMMLECFARCKSLEHVVSDGHLDDEGSFAEAPEGLIITQRGKDYTIKEFFNKEYPLGENEHIRGGQYYDDTGEEWSDESIGKLADLDSNFLPETEQEPDQKPPYLLYGIGGAVILLLAAGLVIFIIRRKKK